ncbi:DUF2628 domain-containing protein [Parvibacter caecicola]|uniref:DUF2628 domain-containing protein n=1 Tax=Parvibacter caecicola TaxID=747645 RepID=UPI001374FCCC|nr:DUF2628 domain-containing protein [Parvibacter caecicola]MCR2040935.1 DUF2628 domain-containing protein [Parvibacter caecicola]
MGAVNNWEPADVPVAAPVNGAKPEQVSGSDLSEVAQCHDEEYEKARCYYAFIEGPVPDPLDEAKNLKMFHRMKAQYSFSFPTVFLGAIYLAYRKCFIGALGMVAAGVLLGVINLLLIPLIGNVAKMVTRFESLLFACFFYRVYRWTADRVYRKGVQQGLRGEALVNHMRAHGGVSILAAAVAVLVFLAVFALLATCLYLAEVG